MHNFVIFVAGLFSGGVLVGVFYNHLVKAEQAAHAVTAETLKRVKAEYNSLKSKL